MAKKIRAKAEAGIATKNEEKPPEPPKEIIEHIKTAIQEAAGVPPKGVNIIVKHLWDDRFRINVYWQEEQGGEQQMIDSYFVRATETAIVSADPAFHPFRIPVVKEEKEEKPLGKV